MEAPDPIILALDLQNIATYNCVAREPGNGAVVTLEAFPRLSYLEAGQQLATSADSGLRAIGLWAIGRTLLKHEFFSIDINGSEHKLNQQQLFVEALACDVHFSHAYRSLGVSLSSDETVKLHDDRTLNKLELYVEALRWNANFAFAYNNLGNILSDEETVQLSDGRHLNKLELFLEALRCDPNYNLAYYNLGVHLSSTETVMLHDGRTLGPRQLYVESLRCNPKDAETFLNLGCSLSSKDTVVLHDGRTLNQRQLFLESLLCDHSQVHVRDWLQKTMPEHECWSRRSHSLLFGYQTNKLFSTLLLGVQRLEEAGVLLLAHQAMLEDTMECWLWSDSAKLCQLGIQQ